jgi:hypothetical protein
VNSVCQTKTVPEFCTCGAQLPPDARFCHKCGKPQYEYPGIEEPEAAAAEVEVASLPPVVHVQLPAEISFHNWLAVRIGFIAAAAAVILSMIPIPLAWLRLPVAFVAAGFLAVYLYSRRTGQVLSLRSGARMGWITGVFSFAIVGILVGLMILAIMNEPQLVKQIQSQLPPNDASADSLVRALNDPAKLSAELSQSLVLLFVLLTALPIIGGALGAKVLEKE